MLQELTRGEYPKVQPLVPGPHLALVIDAVVAGNSPATIWVDSVADPRAAFMWDRSHCLYLAGTAQNPAFNTALARLLREQIVPDASRRALSLFKVHYASEAWERVAAPIFAPIPLAQKARAFYRFEALRICDWRERIPDGYRVRAIDRPMLADVTLRNVEPVREEIVSCWRSVGDFLGNGFGVCLLRDNEIVSWCTAEYLSAGKCGVGIETVEAYQGRGLATLTACALVEESLARGITLHWDSWSANLPSIAVAEKVGFRKLVDYSVFLGAFGPAAATP